MSAKLTKTQIEGLRRIADGHPHSFGSGLGNYRVALRALTLRAVALVDWRSAFEPGDEVFRITEAGRAALAEQGGDNG